MFLFFLVGGFIFLFYFFVKVTGQLPSSQTEKERGTKKPSLILVTCLELISGVWELRCVE